MAKQIGSRTKLSKAEVVKANILEGKPYTPPERDNLSVLTDFVTFSDGSVLNLKTLTVYK